MQKFNYQTAIRMSETLKEEIDTICDKHQIRPSDFIRYSIKETILNYSRDGENKPDRLMFA